MARDSSSHLVTRYFSYDLADRLLSQELPGGRIVSYGWDANGNMTSLTPPGRPVHGFTYDAVDLNSQYVAPSPAVGQPVSTTVYEYDLEKNLKRVTRPDNAQVVITRDPTIGRVTTLTHAHAVSRYAYWDTPQPGASLKTGQLKSITRESTPDTVAVSFGYDGPLLTSETWSGAVSGRVEHAYNNAFRETLERVQVHGAGGVERILV